MSLSQTAINFANKILKHNPINKKQSSCCQHQKHSKKANQNEESNQNPIKKQSLKQKQNQNNHHHNHNHKDQQIKPYLHAHDHRKERQIYQKSTQQKLANMRIFKQEGNDHYKNQRFRQAAYLYQKVIVYSDYTFPQQKSDEEELSKLIQQANCNLGISLIKMNEWDKSQTFFIQSKKGNQQKLIKKSTYWICKLYLRRGDLQKAQNQINILKKLSQNQNLYQQQNAQVQQLQKLLKNQKTLRLGSQKKIYESMFKEKAQEKVQQKV